MFVILHIILVGAALFRSHAKFHLSTRVHHILVHIALCCRDRVEDDILNLRDQCIVLPLNR